MLLLSLSIGFKKHNQQNVVKWPKGNQNIYIMYLQLGTDCYPRSNIVFAVPIVVIVLVSLWICCQYFAVLAFD